MTTEQQEIGALIRAKRKEKHWTQAKLAEQLNLTRDAIFAYEKGKVKVIPYEKRVKLSTILNIPLVNLLYLSEKIEATRDELKAQYNVLMTNLVNNAVKKPVDNEKINELFFKNVKSDILNLFHEELDSAKFENKVKAILDKHFSELLNSLKDDHDTKK